MLHLKEYRKKKNLKQADVANELGISRQAYSHYEVGKRQPDYEILCTKIHRSVQRTLKKR